MADTAYWDRLFALADEHDFVVLADECYADIYYGAPPMSALTARHAATGGLTRLLSFQSLSKRSGLPGLRSGLVTGDAALLARFRAFRNVAAPTVPGPLLAVWIGKHYEGAAYLMVIFTLAAQMNLMTGPGTSILRGIGHPTEEFHYNIPNVVALGLSVPLSYLVLGKWTVLGIGTAVAGSTIVAAIYFVMHANRLMNVTFGRYLKSVFLPGAFPYVLAALFAVPANFAATHLNRWVAGGCIAGMIGVYVVLLVLLVGRFILETGERLWFQAIIQSKLGKFLPSSPPV